MLCFWFIRVLRYFQQLWDCAAAGLLFCVLINTVGIFFLSTELWNVFRGSGSGYSGTVSETGVRMTEYLNLISPPASCPIRVLLSSLSVSLSHSAPLAVATHFQCHNEKCQISWILLISKDTFPVMHHYAWNQSYSLFMSFFLSIWFLSDLILSIWQASVSAPGPLGINGLSEYAVIRSTNLGCGQLIAGD